MKQRNGELRIYSAGTLRYTSSGLILLMVWLLWGDFCLCLMEAIIPNVMPIKLKLLGASSTMISVLLSTVPGIIALTWNPIVSTMSDRHRGRFGRRIPFLLAGTPCIVLVFVGLGFSDYLNKLLKLILPESIAFATISLGLVVFLMFFFHIFNSMVFNLYFSLFNDVVPPEWMGRFAVLFRIVGTAGGATFNILLFPYAESHMCLIFIGSAVLYAVAYITMCLKVKEGDYPPPPPKEPGLFNPFKLVKSYYRECFGHKFYWYLYLSGGFYGIGATMLPFILLMNLSLGISMEQLGWINGCSSLVSIPFFIITGYLVERFNLLRLYFWMKVLQTIAWAGFLIFLFVDLPFKWVLIVVIVLNIFLQAINAVLLVAGIPMVMHLLPRLYYGQFCAAMAIVSGIMIIAGGFLGGIFMDLMKSLCNGNDFFYRFSAIWGTVFVSLGAYYIYKLYREITLSHGEDLSSFVPPDPIDISSRKQNQ